jgi:hypothetical protein
VLDVNLNAIEPAFEVSAYDRFAQARTDTRGVKRTLRLSTLDVAALEAAHRIADEWKTSGFTPVSPPPPVATTWATALLMASVATHHDRCVLAACSTLRPDEYSEELGRQAIEILRRQLQLEGDREALNAALEGEVHRREMEVEARSRHGAISRKALKR